MARHHKKTKKHSRRRRMRGGTWLRPEWLFGAPTPEQVAADAAPAVDATLGTPTQQAAALGVAPGAPSAPAGAVAPGAPTQQAAALGVAPGATPLGGRRRKTRKHRKSRRKH